MPLRTQAAASEHAATKPAAVGTAFRAEGQLIERKAAGSSAFGPAAVCVVVPAG
jgi:hypothetical protein